MSTESRTTSAEPTFEDDLAFLRQHGEVLLLTAPSGARVAVSPAYQARVMTSAVEPRGASFGWIHRAFIAGDERGTAFDNFGGEDRFWLGPEGGQYGLYFPPGASFTFDAWQVPHEIQEGAWTVKEAGTTHAVLTRTMRVQNWSGTTFDVGVERRIALSEPSGIGGPLPTGVRAVGFESTNRITNLGPRAWTRDTGLPSIWILAMFAPAKDGRVILPFEPGASGPLVNDAYFGKVPAERLRVDAQRGFLTFVVDGALRSKIGLPSARATSTLGAYSARANLLTVVTYAPGPLRDRPYVNSMWERQAAPYAGDVVNSYNDGPVGPGKPPLGGFYEIETSSPGAELGPGQSLEHRHATFHYVGPREALEPVAQRLLGVSLGAL